MFALNVFTFSRDFQWVFFWNLFVMRVNTMLNLFSQHVTVCHRQDMLMFSAVHRKKALRKTKLFTCTCERCQGGRTLTAQVSGVPCVFFGLSATYIYIYPIKEINMRMGNSHKNISFEDAKIIFFQNFQC